MSKGYDLWATCCLLPTAFWLEPRWPVGFYRAGSRSSQNEIRNYFRRHRRQQNAVAEVAGGENQILNFSITQNRQVVSRVGPQASPRAPEAELVYQRHQVYRALENGKKSLGGDRLFEARVFRSRPYQEALLRAWYQVVDPRAHHERQLARSFELHHLPAAGSDRHLDPHPSGDFT